MKNFILILMLFNTSILNCSNTEDNDGIHECSLVLFLGYPAITLGPLHSDYLEKPDNELKKFIYEKQITRRTLLMSENILLNRANSLATADDEKMRKMGQKAIPYHTANIERIKKESELIPAIKEKMEIEIPNPTDSTPENMTALYETIKNELFSDHS